MQPKGKVKKACEAARYPLLDVRGCRLRRCPFSFSFILYQLTIVEAIGVSNQDDITARVEIKQRSDYG